MNYSELLQLAKGWGNFISDRIIIWRLRNEETARARAVLFHFVNREFGYGFVLSVRPIR